MSRFPAEERGCAALIAVPDAVAQTSKGIAPASKPILLSRETPMLAQPILAHGVAAACYIAALVPQVGREAAMAAAMAVDAVNAGLHVTPVKRQVAIIEAAMPILGLSNGATQFVLARAGLLSDRPMTATDHRDVRFTCWRRGPLPQPDGALPGRSVRILPGRLHEHGYIRCVEGRSVILVCESHISTAADRSDFRVRKATSPDFIPRRLAQPGGYIRQEDSSTIIFSRDTLPLWRVAASGAVQQMNPWEMMPSVRDCCRVYVEGATGREWSSDAGQKWSRDLLDRHGIKELPLLVDVLPYLMGNDLQLEEAVKLMQADTLPWDAAEAI